MSLAVVSIVYNEANNLERMVGNVAPHVDEIHLLDGAYADFSQGSSFFLSTDETKAVAEALARKFPNLHFHETAQPFPNQIEKRTASLRLSSAEYLLILDADEWLANPEALRDLPYGNFDIGWIEIRSSLYFQPYWAPRILRNLPDLHYAGRHHWIYRGEELFCSHQQMNPAYRNLDLPVVCYNLLATRESSRVHQKHRFVTRRNVSEFSYPDENAVYGACTPLAAHPQRAGKTQPLPQVLKRPSAPKYSLIVPFSRDWAVDRWFSHFAHVEMPWAETEILVSVDTADDRFYQRVLSNFSAWLPRVNGLRARKTGNPPIREFSTVAQRRARIVQQWYNFLNDAVGEILVGAEDDTLPDYDAYPRLLQVMEEREASFVQGTIVGRWSHKVIPHWHVPDTEASVPTLIETARWDPSMPEVIPIHGGGWYCFVANLSHLRRLDLGRYAESGPMGPDVSMVWNLHKSGHRCYGVWSVGCTHFLQDRDLHPTGGTLHKSVYFQDSSGTWGARTEDIPPVGALRPPPTLSLLEVTKMEKVTFRASRSIRIDGEMYYSGQTLQLDGLRAKQMEQRNLGMIINLPAAPPTPPAPPAPEAKPELPKAIQPVFTLDIPVNKVDFDLTGLGEGLDAVPPTEEEKPKRKYTRTKKA